MGISALDTTIVAGTIKGHLSDRQGRFLHEVLACSSPSSLAGGRASLQTTLVLTLPALVASLTSFVVSTQPERKLIEKIRDATISVASRLGKLFPANAQLSALNNCLSGLLDFEALEKEDIRRVSKDLCQYADSLETVITGLARSVWLGSGFPSNEALERVAHELSAYRAEFEADYSRLVADVRNLATNPKCDAYLREFLNPSFSSFKVVVAVAGTKHLNGLNNFFSAYQFIHGEEDTAAWGTRTKTLKEFSQLHSYPSAVVFLQLRVNAPDMKSAALRARRKVSEVLDQYVAGHRLVDLRLARGAAVFDCEKSSASLDTVSGPGVPSADPLTSNWPIQLRESLRMGHLAVIADSPMTQIALSWSAIEAAGLGTAEFKILASALTLQTLRHQVNESYMYLSQGFRAKEKVLGAMEDSLFDRYKKAADKKAKATNPLAIMSLEGKISELEIERQSLELTLDAHDLPLHGFDYIDKVVISDHRGYPKSMNIWADLLQPSMLAPGVDPGRAHRQVRELQTKLEGIHTARITAWQERFADPKKFEIWCLDQRLRFEQALYLIYAARNVVIHTGAIAARGDVQLADSGMAIVDLFHEILGNWSRVSKIHNIDGWNPRKVLQELSQRLDNVVQAVQDDNIGCVNFDHLTSPTSTSTDRVP